IEHGQGSAKPMEAAGARAAGVRRASGACAQEPTLSDFSLTSASRVPASAMRCCVLSSAGVSTSFMPSLNPRTAPPRSEPMLRSFFVPNTSSTITRTTSQCQMLKEPITLSSMLQHGRQHVRTTQYMDVEMIHLLPADPSRIDDRAEAVVQSLFTRELRRDGHDLAHHRRMFGLHLEHGRDVAFGNHEEMHRRGRVDVVESHDVVVLVEFLRRDLARDDLAENAVAHRTALMPCCGNSSRRCRRCPRGAET